MFLALLLSSTGGGVGGFGVCVTFFEAFYSFGDCCERFLDRREIRFGMGILQQDWGIVLLKNLLDAGMGKEGLKVRLGFSLPFGW